MSTDARRLVGSSHQGQTQNNGYRPLPKPPPLPRSRSSARPRPYAAVGYAAPSKTLPADTKNPLQQKTGSPPASPGFQIKRSSSASAGSKHGVRPAGVPPAAEKAVARSLSFSGPRRPPPPPPKMASQTKLEPVAERSGRRQQGGRGAAARPLSYSNGEGVLVGLSDGRPKPPPKPKQKRPHDYLDYVPLKEKNSAESALQAKDSGPNAISQGSTSHDSATPLVERGSATATATVGSSPTVSATAAEHSPKSTSSESAGVSLSSASSLTSPTSKQPALVTYARPPPREMEYLEREHPKNVFEYLNQMRLKGELCDVILIADTKEIQAHKVVLAACSQYFEQMFVGEFSEPEGEPIYIDEVEEDALMALVDFAYTCRIKITDRNIYSIFEAADLLQFIGVKSTCFKFFKQQINKSNCIRTWLFAESHNCTELMEASLKYLQCNFLEIVRGREFMDLDQPDVVARIFKLEDLAITSEEQVYDGALGWLQHAPEKRRKDAMMVFKNVRFPNISRDYLLHIVDNEPFVKEDPDCLQLLIDALQAHVSTARSTLRRMLRKQKSSGNYSNVMPRSASMAAEVVEIHRSNTILGLRIMGGRDRPNHVFRQGDKPGIFVLKVTAEGAADLTGKMRSGDRILRINNKDVSNVAHDEAIRLLRTSPDPLTLLVRHEPPPVGLRELTLVTKPGEGFGFAICGGVNSYPGNPLDETDEGIFISQIIPGGAAAQDSKLTVGTRILQLNSVSLLGKTHDEALQVLQGVLDRMNLLVCHGYDPDSIPDFLTIDTVDEFGYVGSEALYDQAITSISSNPGKGAS